MGVYIPGMKMPGACYDCPIRKRNGNEIICPILQEEFMLSEYEALFFRLKNCPLVEVPPHGRLIDADDLAYDKETQRKGCVYLEDLNAAPTIIPMQGGN